MRLMLDRPEPDMVQNDRKPSSQTFTPKLWADLVGKPDFVDLTPAARISRAFGALK